MIKRRISGYFQRSEVKTAVVRSQASGVFGFPAANRHHSRDGGFSEENFLKKLPVFGPLIAFLALEIYVLHDGVMTNQLGVARAWDRKLGELGNFSRNSSS